MWFHILFVFYSLAHEWKRYVADGGNSAITGMHRRFVHVPAETCKGWCLCEGYESMVIQTGNCAKFSKAWDWEPIFLSWRDSNECKRKSHFKFHFHDRWRHCWEWQHWKNIYGSWIRFFGVLLELENGLLACFRWSHLSGRDIAWDQARVVGEVLSWIMPSLLLAPFFCLWSKCYFHWREGGLPTCSVWQDQEATWLFHVSEGFCKVIALFWPSRLWLVACGFLATLCEWVFMFCFLKEKGRADVSTEKCHVVEWWKWEPVDFGGFRRWRGEMVKQIFPSRLFCRLLRVIKLKDKRSWFEQKESNTKM